MQKFNLSKKVVYMKGAQEKTYWANVGTMTQFDNGNMIVEIPAIGLVASVFPVDRSRQEAQSAPVEPSVNVEDDIGRDIPF